MARRAVMTGAIDEALLGACLAERRRLRAEGGEASLRSLLLERGVDAARWDALAAVAPPAQGAATTVGDYVLEHQLGRGAMGEVWRARHRDLEQRHALKLLRADSPARRQRFLREATALAKVGGHPNIVRIHTCGLDPTSGAYLVMDLIDGPDLRELLALEGTLAPERALRLAHGIARAIEHMHQARIVHRDLKPANVLVRREDDVPVVADFGLAFDEAQTRLTVTGAVLGTPCYMAPEQAFGAACAPSDVYAVGAIFYEMLTGTIPAPTSGLCPPSALREGLSAALDGLALRALALDPTTRPSAGELAAAFAAVAEGRPAPWRRVARRRRRVVAALGAVALCAVLGLGGAAAWSRRALAEHEAWEAATLAPLALGLRGDLARLDADDLRARRERLTRAAATPGGPDVQAPVKRLDAHLRLLGDARRASSSSADGLVAEALLERAGGRHPAAAQLVDRALALDRRHAPARLLRDHLDAETRPAFVLERLAHPLDDERRALALLAAGAVWSATIARAPRATGNAADPELERAIAAAARLRLDLAPLTAPKAQALEASADAWGQALDAALRAGAETATLERLIRLCATAPAVEPGPALRGVLSGAHDALVGLANAHRTTEQPRPILLRAVRFEERLFAAFGLSCFADAAGQDVLQSLLRFVGRADLTPEDGLSIARACLRAGARIKLGEAAALAPRSSWEAARQRTPGSRAVRAALAWLAPGDDLHADVAAVEAAPQEDLAPTFVGALHARAAERDLHALEAAERSAWSGDPSRTLAAARRAAELLDDGAIYGLFDALRAEGKLVRALRGPAEAVVTWTAAVATLEAAMKRRVALGTSAGVLDAARADEGAEFVAACRVARAECRLALGETDLAERELVDVVDAARAAAYDDKKIALTGRAVLCKLRREAGRLEDAAAALGDPRDFLAAPDLMLEVLRLLLARGERARALELVEGCARRVPERSRDLGELRRLLAE